MIPNTSQSGGRKIKDRDYSNLGDGGTFGQHMIDFFEGMFDFSKVEIKAPEIKSDLGASLSKVADEAEKAGTDLKSLTDVLDDFKDKG